MRGRKQTESDEDILAVVRARDEPVISTREVAKNLSIKPERTRERLKNLYEEGRVKKKKPGGRASTFVWWTPGNFTSTLLVQRIATKQGELDEEIRNLQLPGTDVVLEMRQIAVQMACDYLEGTTKRSLDDVVDYTMDHNPAGYKYQRTALRDLLLKSMETLDQIKMSIQNGNLMVSYQS